MLRNGDNIIKNGESIFKSQVVDSYLNSNSCCLHYPRIRTDGLTASDPLYAYYETPTEVLKTTISSDGTYSLCFDNPASGCNACIKNYYFCGNTNAVECICLYQNNYLDGNYSGSFSCSISQFPQIECVNYGVREVDFNEDISGTYLPPSLICLELFDCGIQGDLTTVENFGCIEDFRFCRTQFTGNLHEIEFNNLQTTFICYANAGLGIDINTLINNNSGYTCSMICQAPGATLCADTLDISQLTYVNWYLPYTNVCGTLCSTLEFNTGMTRFGLRSCCVNADISNWDISDTQMDWFQIYNQYGSNGQICGNISGWTFPASTMQYFLLDYARDVTAVPSDWATLTPNLRQLGLNQMQALSGDVTTWTFPDTQLTTIQMYYTELCGNLENVTFPTGLTTVQFRYSNFTGDIGNIDLPTTPSQYYLEGNCLSGNPSDMTITANQTYLSIAQNPDIYWDLSTPFDSCNLYFMRFDYLSGVTGSFNNFTVGNALRYLCLNFTPVESCLEELDLNNIQYLNLRSSSLSQDITNMFTGTTSLITICMEGNPNLSGDTTGWNIADVNTLQLCGTALSGRLCTCNPFCLNIFDTDICSCIDTDMSFASNSYNINIGSSKVQGCLSGTSLNYSNIYQFLAYNNPDLYGANDFTDEIFVNRGNFNRSYVLIQYQSIGDNVTGTTEQLGDLGTYGGDPSGMDLTEAQVNNLVAGIDYDGGGSNTPWDSKEKIWWMKNACISSSSTTRRYSQFTISYS